MRIHVSLPYNVRRRIEMCDDRSKTMWRERCGREAEDCGVRCGEGVEGVVAHRTMAAALCWKLLFRLIVFFVVWLRVSLCLREREREMRAAM